MSIYTYTPYTYLIGWSKLDRWYYGVRYAKKTMCLYEAGCHPDDLWVTYFTSSKQVQKFRNEHGEPDVVSVRKQFKDSENAKNWEHKLLKKLNVVVDGKWLNQNDQFAPPDITKIPGVAEKISKTLKIKGVVPYCKNTHSPEAIAKTKAKMAGRKWYHNPHTGKATISHACPEGWLPGKVIKGDTPPPKIRGIDYECHAYSWKVTDPFGKEHNVFNLKNWCEERKVSYGSVYGSRKGWKSVKIKGWEK